MQFIWNITLNRWACIFRHLKVNKLFFPERKIILFEPNGMQS